MVSTIERFHCIINASMQSVTFLSNYHVSYIREKTLEMVISYYDEKLPVWLNHPIYQETRFANKYRVAVWDELDLK